LKKVASLLSHLETKGQKSATEGLVRLRGRPKYVKGRVPLEQPKLAANSSNLVADRLTGSISDLSKFTLRPEEAAKEMRRALRLFN